MKSLFPKDSPEDSLRSVPPRIHDELKDRRNFFRNQAEFVYPSESDSLESQESTGESTFYYEKSTFRFLVEISENHLSSIWARIRIAWVQKIRWISKRILTIPYLDIDNHGTYQIGIVCFFLDHDGIDYDECLPY